MPITWDRCRVMPDASMPWALTRRWQRTGHGSMLGGAVPALYPGPRRPTADVWALFTSFPGPGALPAMRGTGRAQDCHKRPTLSHTVQGRTARFLPFTAARGCRVPFLPIQPGK